MKLRIKIAESEKVELPLWDWSKWEIYEIIKIRQTIVPLQNLVMDVLPLAMFYEIISEFRK